MLDGEAPLTGAGELVLGRRHRLVSAEGQGLLLWGEGTQGWVRSNELQILDSDFRKWWSLLKLKGLNFLLFWRNPIALMKAARGRYFLRCDFVSVDKL